MDLNEIVRTGAYAVTGTWAGKKVVGPTLEMYGKKLADLNERQLNRLGKIINNAVKKSDSNGVVPERVMNKALLEAVSSDNPLIIEYWGGVLASSMSESEVDDRGTYWASEVATLSTFQLRLHYIVYFSLSRLLKNDLPVSLGLESDRSKLKVYISASELVSAMSVDDSKGVINHAINGLKNRGLLDDEWGFGSIEYLKSRQKKNFSEEGLFVTPSAAGFELFLWVMGHGKEDLGFFFNSSSKFLKISSVKLSDKAKLLKNMDAV